MWEIKTAKAYSDPAMRDGRVGVDGLLAAINEFRESEVHRRQEYPERLRVTGTNMTLYCSQQH